MGMHKTDEPKDARPIRGRVLARVLAEDLRNVAGGYTPREPIRPGPTQPSLTMTSYLPGREDSEYDGD